MIIGINELHEIKQIGSITDPNLTQIEVDRDLVFGGMSDFKILHYKYVSYGENAYSVVPAIDCDTLNLVDKVYQENQELKKVSKQQDTLLLETDLRLMDLEFAIEELAPTPFSLNLARGSYFDLLMRMIEEENYTSKEQMLSNIDKYFSRGRITEEEYYKLKVALYPEFEVMPLNEEEPKKTPRKRKAKKEEI